MASSPWVKLQDGQSTTTKPGYFYAALAHVKNNHNEAYIRAWAKAYGFTIVVYEDPARAYPPDPNSGYRFIAATGVSTRAVTLPWGVPSPWSAFDETTRLRTWEAPPGGSIPSPPWQLEKPTLPPLPGQYAGVGLTAVMLVGLPAAAIAAWLLRKRIARLVKRR